MTKLDTGVWIAQEDNLQQDRIQRIGEESPGTFTDPSFKPLINLAFVTRLSIENLLSRERGPSGKPLSSVQVRSTGIALSDFSARTKKYAEVSELIKQSYLENLRRDLTSLSQNYTFRRSSEVLEFLSDNVSLMPLIEEAYRKIREYFPEEKLILEVVADPEVDNEKELMIFIHTTLNPDEALERLDMLDENWWLDASLEAGEKLCVHMEFQ